MVRRKLLSALVVLATAAVALVVTPTAAHAAPPSGLGWDGISPTDSRASVCQADVSTKMWADIYVNGSRTGQIQLRYSAVPQCRTVWARLVVYTIPSEGDGHITRSAPARTEVCIDELVWSSVVNAWTCFTPMLYDGGYVSRASGGIILPGVGEGAGYTGWY